jgi:hypothetical protein
LWPEQVVDNERRNIVRRCYVPTQYLTEKLQVEVLGRLFMADLKDIVEVSQDNFEEPSEQNSFMMAIM